jgi:hypothetical protein
MSSLEAICRRVWRSGPSGSPASLLAASLVAGACILQPVGGVSAAEIFPGTIGVDYRNRPEVAALTGYEYVVLSPRAALEANNLFSRGSKILYWIQPVVCFWKGKPPSEATFEGAVYRLAQGHGALLQDSTGNRAEIRGDDIEACYLVDFRNREFAEQMAALVSQRFKGVAGILFDYGCPDLAWEVSLKSVDPTVWKDWAEGYRAYRERIRELEPGWKLFCQCDRWASWLPGVCDGLALEKVGWSLIPYPEAWRTMNARASQNVLLVEEPEANRVPSRRRLTAALCYLTDGLFAYREASSGIPLPIRDPEHFELYLGEFEEGFTEPSPGVYERHSTHGVVVANLSDKPHRHGDYTIAPEDALIAQTRDRESGEPIDWLTTLDR